MTTRGEATPERALTVEQVRELIAAGREQPQVNHILHGFPSVRMWPDDPVVAEQAAEEIDDWYADDTGPTDGYIGFPYCVATDPERCGYCLFPSEVFRRSSDSVDYLDLVRAERPIWRHRAGRLTSVFVGGGTPNLLRSDQLEQLRATIDERFPEVDRDTVVTVEGIPQLFSEGKVAALAAIGVQRISMGAQQMDAELLAMSGRRETPEHIVSAVESAARHGMACNVDLIFGWPRQTIDSMVDGLDRLARTGVDHITHYEMNVGGPSDFALHHRHEMPDPETLRAMYLAGVEVLVGHGYRQLTTHDFVRDPTDGSDWLYQESWGSTHRRTVLAAGFAGITELYRPDMGAGFVAVNHRSLPTYRDAVGRGEPPVERWFRRSAEDVRLTALFRCLQGLEVDRRDYLDSFGTDVVDDQRALWDVLGDEGWAEVDTDRVRLGGLGAYYVPRIQSIIATHRTRELRAALRATGTTVPTASDVRLTPRR